MNITDHFNEINIVQIGCGGTGSWIVPLASKLINNVRLRLPDTVKVHYKLVDNDVVEERNILRQNFSEWDIGKSKAHSLVNRYIYNFKELQAFPYRIKTKQELFDLIHDSTQLDNEKLIIILDCVDNNKSRHLFYKSLEYYRNHYSPKIKIVFIDGGNLLYHGQVVTLSFGFEEFLLEKYDQFEPDKATELRKQIKKRRKLNFIKMFPIEDPAEVQQSCVFFGDQSQAINNMTATIMFNNLQRILVLSEMPPQEISFNSSGYSTFEV